MRLAVFFLALVLVAPASAVTIDWVSVGDAGNAADPAAGSFFGGGAVAYDYRISETEVTNDQYTEFLNAADPSGANALGLYRADMGSSSFGGIDFVSGNPNGSKYEVKSSFANKPVNYVSVFDALRFANWMHNGQGAGSTETGAYTLLGGTPIPSNWLTVTRNVGVATVFLTSEDEWYKAAYYDASTLSYNPYPFADGFNGAACEAAPGTTSHSANCDEVVDALTDVGAYTGSPSEYGTFDQGGNVFEWNEAIWLADRGLRGGSFHHTPDFLAASGRFFAVGVAELNWVGFRVASLPEPAALTVDVDIKPGSCPNAWNRNSNGVLPVAVLGTGDFDVSEIDVASVRLCLPGEDATDPTAKCAAPHEGPPGPHTVVDDVGTPFEGEACDCHEAEGDGYLDLSMKFKTQDVVAALGLEGEDPGALVELVVAGTLVDETPFEGSDCVRLVPPGTPPGLCRVHSNAAGAWVDVAPLDDQLDGGGFTSFERTYWQSTLMTLTASPTHNGRSFQGWRVDGGPVIPGETHQFVVNNNEQTLEAVYKAKGCGIGGFELALVLPGLMWLHRRRRRLH